VRDRARAELHAVRCGSQYGGCVAEARSWVPRSSSSFGSGIIPSICPLQYRGLFILPRYGGAKYPQVRVSSNGVPDLGISISPGKPARGKSKRRCGQSDSFCFIAAAAEQIVLFVQLEDAGRTGLVVIFQIDQLKIIIVARSAVSAVDPGHVLRAFRIHGERERPFGFVGLDAFSYIAQHGALLPTIVPDEIVQVQYQTAADDGDRQTADDQVHSKQVVLLSEIIEIDQAVDQGDQKGPEEVGVVGRVAQHPQEIPAVQPAHHDQGHMQEQEPAGQAHERPAGPDKSPVNPLHDHQADGGNERSGIVGQQFDEDPGGGQLLQEHARRRHNELGSLHGIDDQMEGEKSGEEPPIHGQQEGPDGAQQMAARDGRWDDAGPRW